MNSYCIYCDSVFSLWVSFAQITSNSFVWCKERDDPLKQDFYWYLRGRKRVKPITIVVWSGREEGKKQCNTLLGNRSQLTDRQMIRTLTNMLWDNNKLRGLKRHLEHYGWLERCGCLDWFCWLGSHCRHSALEGLNYKALIQGNLFLNREFSDVDLVSNSK